MLSAMLPRLVPHVAAATIAATLAGTFAIACNKQTPGPRLAGAGSREDDGSGALAEASVKFTTASEAGFEPTPVDQPYNYGYGYDGGYNSYTYGGFGGDWYGGGGYGGNLYASYVPNFPYNQANRQIDYVVSYAPDNGAIEGQVTWPKPPKAPATLAGPSGCGAVDNPSLKLGKGNAVEGAIVYLEKITSGRALTQQQYGAYKPIVIGGSIEMRDCALSPRVQVQIPVPGQLTISNGHDVPVTLVVERPGDGSVEQRLDVGGSKVVGLSAVGVTRVGDHAGALAPAWVVSANHPYYAMTDDRGRFRLDDVVPGDYTLIAWHPPVVTGVVDGKVQHGDPVIVTKKITVKKTAATKVAFSLP